MDERIINILKPSEVESFCGSVLRQAFRKSLVQDIGLLHGMKVGEIKGNWTEILEKYFNGL